MSVIPNNNSIVIFYNDRNFSIPIENCPFLFVVALLATYFQFVDGFKRMDASVRTSRKNRHWRQPNYKSGIEFTVFEYL